MGLDSRFNRNTTKGISYCVNTSVLCNIDTRYPDYSVALLTVHILFPLRHATLGQIVLTKEMKLRLRNSRRMKIGICNMMEDGSQ